MNRPKYKELSNQLYRALEAVLPYCVFDNFTGMYAQQQAIEAIKAIENKEQS